MKGHNFPPRSVRAFTLIEIMIAIAILSMVLMAIYSSWSAILRSSKVGLEAAAQVQRTRIAVRSIVEALLTVQMFAGNAAYYAFIADTGSDFAYLSLVSRLPASFPDAGLFGDQVVRRVTFQVEPGTDFQQQLVMYQMPILAEVNAQQKPFPVVLARDISRFTLEFWDPRAADWDKEWLVTNQLPKVVRVTLGFGRARGFMHQPQDLVTRVVALPAMAVPLQYQVAPLPAQGARPGVPNRGGQNPPLQPGAGEVPGQFNPAQPNVRFDFNRPGGGSQPMFPPGGLRGGTRRGR